MFATRRPSFSGIVIYLRFATGNIELSGKGNADL